MEELKNEILKILNKRSLKHNSIKKLADNVSKILKKPYDDVLGALLELEKDGKIFEYHKHKYVTSDYLGLKRGVLSFTSQSYAFVLCEEGDIFVSKKNLLGGFDKDLVLVKIISSGAGYKNREGKVVKILKRSDEAIVGNFVKIKSYGYVKPIRKKQLKDIFISAGDCMNAKDGDFVVVELTSFKSGNPVGKITEVIGAPDSRGNDIKSLLRQFKVVEKFDEGALSEILNFDKIVKKEKYPNRRDLTDIMMFTIDGADAKDLDDAVSLTKNKDGTFLLGVHIADVGEYVKKDSKLDLSAFERGSSIYFLNQVIPMLPKELSNFLCSLNPDVERLALSVFMKIDSSGEVLESEVFESVIKSKYQLNYDEVLSVLQGDNEKQQKKLGEIKKTLLDMWELSKILQTKRQKLGSIDFDLPESVVVVDENNKPLEVLKKMPTDSTRIIETFMVVANETIAKKFETLKLPFIYRVHEKPDPEKIKVFFDFIATLGKKYKPEGKETSSIDLQNILHSVKNLPIKNVVNMVLLRSLKKAKYFDECLGHFGLALKYYCHFTSPIRRYPDLVIHRIIKEFLKGNTTFVKSKFIREFVKKASIQSSERERISEEVERAIVDYKKCEFMKQFIGKNFEGIISAISSRGFFVELDNTCEGFVNVSDIKDDFYNFDEKTLMLKGSNKFYRIGERVEIKVTDCNLNERKLNFKIIRKKAI